MNDRILYADDPVMEPESCVDYYDFLLEDGIRIFDLNPDDECGIILGLREIADRLGEAYTIRIGGTEIVTAKVRRQELTVNLCRLLLALYSRETTKGIKKFRFSKDFPRLDDTGRGFDTNYATLRHFNLMKRVDILVDPSPSKKAKTTWALTEKGRSFCEGREAAPSYARVSEQKLVSLSPKSVFIYDILSPEYLAKSIEELAGKDQS